MAAAATATEAPPACDAAPSAPPSQGAADDAPLALEALHSTDGFCEVVHLSSDSSSMLSAGWDGKLAAVNNTAGQPPSKAWMARIAGKGGMLTAAAVSADAGWLALSQEYSNGFGVWVCPLDGKKGPDMDRSKLVARFTLPVRHLAWHPSKPILGIASNDGKLLTWDRSSSKRRDFPTGRDGGAVHCVAFDPQGEFLATALASGALVIFSMADGTEKYRGSAWKKNIIGSGDRFLMAWRPDGTLLALPGATSVRLVARGNYATNDLHLELGGHRYPTSMAAWSADGSVLATASVEAVALWRPPQLVKVCRITAAPHSLFWGGDTLAIGTAVGSWAHVTTPPLASEAAAANTSTEEAVTQDGATPDAATTPAAPSQTDATSQETLQTQTPDVPMTPAPVEVVPLHQAAFQPGATRDLEARRQYLAFNGHGALKLFLGEQSGRVEVEYNQLRFRSAVREIRAPDGLVMGALGPGVCVLAAAPKNGQPAKVIMHSATNPKGVQVGSRTSSSHMEHVFPEGEEVVALAVGKQFVASLTSKSNLFVKSTSGEQVSNVPLSGSPVCLVAGEDMLLCILKRSPAEGADLLPSQNSSPQDMSAQDSSSEHIPQGLDLSYVLYSVAADQQLARGRLPISAGASLRWCGISAEALPLALDSSGVLWALSVNRNTDAPYNVLAAEWQSAAELEDSGRRLWPVRAEGHSLFCLELSKGLHEPRVGAVQKLKETRYKRPQPARVAAKAQRGEAECQQALTDFEASAKMGDVEEALDVILNYFESHTSHRTKLLTSAHSLAEKLGEEELAERLTAILQVTSGGALPPQSVEQQPAAEESSMAPEIEPQHEQAVAEEQASKPSFEKQEAQPAAKDTPANDEAMQMQEVTASAPNLDQEVARRIAENRAKALERRAAAEATKGSETQAAAALPASALDPEVARRIAENRVKALERKAAIAAAATTKISPEKRARSPSAEVDGNGKKCLLEAPSAVRLRAC